MYTRKNYFVLFLVSIILTFTSFFYIASKAEILAKYWGNDYILEIYQHQFSIDKLMIQSCLLFLCIIFSSLILFIFNIKNKLIIYSISTITLILFIGLNISLNIAPTDTNLSELGTNDTTLVTDSIPAVIEPNPTVIESNETSVDTTSNIAVESNTDLKLTSSFFYGTWLGGDNVKFRFFDDGSLYIKLNDENEGFSAYWKYENKIIFLHKDNIQKLYIYDVQPNSISCRFEGTENILQMTREIAQ